MRRNRRARLAWATARIAIQAAARRIAPRLRVALLLELHRWTEQELLELGALPVGPGLEGRDDLSM